MIERQKKEPVFLRSEKITLSINDYINLLSPEKKHYGRGGRGWGTAFQEAKKPELLSGKTNNGSFDFICESRCLFGRKLLGSVHTGSGRVGRVGFLHQHVILKRKAEAS